MFNKEVFNMKLLKISLALVSLISISNVSAFAQQTPESGITSGDNHKNMEGHHGPHGPRNPAIEQALHECAESLGGSESNHPDRSKMDACMTKKGFDKPHGPPPEMPGMEKM
jgi:Spy/CpxP family protein refolding chaperone